MRRSTALAGVIAVVLPLGLVAADHSATAGTPTYLDPAYPPAERAADLVARMTLPEKASQMVSSMAAAVPRLGVAAYGWWNEAAHGVAREQTNDGDNPPDLINTTSYPVSLSLGSTWNPDLVRREASLISDEAREVVRDNRFDLDFYSPTINLSRDPRWGRNDETFSEDPLLTASLAAQFVNGLQGPAGGYRKAIATLKHYAANNSESNRLNGSSDMDERTLREYYTAQFRDVIRWSDPGSIMSAYNSVNGVPSAANVHLIDTLARQTYGFRGYFTSDCDAVYEIMAGQNWLPPGADHLLDQFGRTAYAQTAGVDLDCDQGYHDDWNYANTVPEAVARGIRTATGVYTENDVDVSVMRLFTARIGLGEFDAESRVPWVAAARRRLAPGTWVNSDANQAVTETPQRLAMARAVADESIVLLQNRGVLPLGAPRRIAVIGPYGDPPDMYLGGYSSAQGKAGVAKSVTVLQGLKAALPSATVDFLPGTAPGSPDILDPASIEKAARYDAVVVCAGTDRDTASEDRDRTDLALPGSQAELIRRVAAVNPRTIVYLETVGPVDLSAFRGTAAAILWSSFNGQQKGAALADVVTGAVDATGRLPFTWYASEDQLPPIEDYAIRPGRDNPGRTYQYFTGVPAYPFGFGLGYTGFRWSDPEVDRSEVDANGSVRVTATVTNTGERPGSDVIQLYATTPDAPAAAQRPHKRLVAFGKVALKPHESTRVAFPVRVADLAFFDEKAGSFQVDQGRYGLQLAATAADRDVRLRVDVSVRGRLQPTPAVVTAKPVVFVPAGSRIDPRLTVALTDQSLYGYVTAGRSRPLPAGMTVRYDSDRPSVISAAGPELRARRSGVATVTATVTYRGGTARGSFVLAVR